MFEAAIEEYPEPEFTFNDVKTGVKSAGLGRGYPVPMGVEQSSFALVADTMNPALRQCTDDMARAFPRIAGNNWMHSITDDFIRNEAYTMASSGFVDDLSSFIRAQIPRRIMPLLDPVTRTAEREFPILSLELGDGFAVDINAIGEAWGVGEDYVDHDVALNALFRRSSYTSSSR